MRSGDYVSQEIAGFRFFLILGKDDVVRGFHNICRHRAFPVAVKASGSSTVLGCKYHGWCYDTKGKLVKAPQFDNIEGFDKNSNSLYEIKTKVDKIGFLYINLNTSDDERDTTPSVTKLGRPSRINPTSRFLYSCELKGKFNWKIAGTAMNWSLVMKEIVLTQMVVHKDPWIDIGDTHETAANNWTGFFTAFSTRILTPTGRLTFPPITTVYTKSGSGLWYQISYCPESQDLTTLRCDVYSYNMRKAEASLFDDNKKDALDRQLRSRIQKYEVEQTRLSKTSLIPDNKTGRSMLSKIERGQ